MIITRLLGKNAFGYEPAELEGRSILGILHPADHEPFVQTVRALLATTGTMAAGTAGVEPPPQSVRVLHRIFSRSSGAQYPPQQYPQQYPLFCSGGLISEVMVDSVIATKPPSRRVITLRKPSRASAHPEQAAPRLLADLTPHRPTSCVQYFDTARVRQASRRTYYLLTCVRLGADVCLVMSSRRALPCRTALAVGRQDIFSVMPVECPLPP